MRKNKKDEKWTIGEKVGVGLLATAFVVALPVVGLAYCLTKELEKLGVSNDPQDLDPITDL